MTQQFLHTTPSELIQDVIERHVTINAPSPHTSRTFTLTLPTEIDPLLDHPSTEAAFESDEYLPYWADLWPASQMLGQAILTASTLPNHVLEIGCGLGLAGLVALSRGCQVTFSDYDAAALAFADKNARQNGFTQFETLQMDWRHPPTPFKFPLILAADVMYEARHVRPVVQLIAQCLTEGGECWLVDPNRPYADHFCQALTAAHLKFQTIATATNTMATSIADSRIAQGTLYKIGLSTDKHVPSNSRYRHYQA